MILVTSANGNQGQRLIPKLLAAGHTVRASVRSEKSALALRALGVHEVLVGDIADAAFIAKAVHGIASIYHIGPTLHQDERIMGFAMIDAARAAGVGHFVFSSVLHAITTDLIQHEIKRDLEEHLLSSGMAYTILQPANYMLPHRLKQVFDEDVFRLPWSLDKRQSMVDLDDVTDVVALVLAKPELHAAATYELAAPGHFSGHDIGRVLSDVLGRAIRTERMDGEAFIRSRMGNADPSALAYQVKMIRAIETRLSNHDFTGNSNVLTWLLGRPPTTFEAFVRKEVLKSKAK